MSVENEIFGEKYDKSSFEFKDLEGAQEYLEWKKAVPSEVRKQVESILKGNKYQSSNTGLFLHDQFLEIFGKMLAKNNELDFHGIDKKVLNLLLPLEKIETKSGYLNVFETLANPDASWNLKKKIYETQIKPALDWLVEKDLEKIAKESRQNLKKEKESGGEQESNQKEKQEDDGMPPDQDEAVSSMEAGRKGGKEGEPVSALFSVAPFFGGYASDKEFDRLGENFRWQKSKKEELFENESEQYELSAARIISGKIKGEQILALPVFDNWTVDRNHIKTNAPKEAMSVLEDEQGKFYLRINAEGIFNYAIRIAPRLYLKKEQKAEKFNIEGRLPEDLISEIQKLKDSHLPKMKLKREVVKLVRNNLIYSNSREAWDFYTENSGQEFFSRIWQRKEADCFVSNTLAARVLAEIDEYTILVGGYYIKEKDEKGNAIMHRNNGHGWLKTWDDLSQRYVRLDATPKGDPNLDEEQQEKDLEGESSEGDYGENEDELISEEELKEKIEKMKGEKEKKERKKPTPVNLEEARFAELAECTPKQAEEFMNALYRVREIKNERGIPISDLLKSEWKKIVTERKIEVDNYRGPVRMDEGDNLTDPVSARIDILSKEFNPTGFEKLEKEEKIEMEFGGINIYFSFDLSGSMRESDGKSGRSKADVQRDMALLFVDSLMQCAYISRQQGGNSDLLPIKIMVTLASDTGETRLGLTDKWGPKEQWAFYSSLNKPASGGTPTHKALEKIEVNFNKEIAELKKKKIPKEKMPLHYVVEISDGASDDFSETEAMHEKLKNKGMVVRSYCIGGESASVDAAEPIGSFSELPEILSKDIVEKFKKLNPKRIRQ